MKEIENLDLTHLCTNFVLVSGKQQNIVIFAKKFLPDKDLDKYFLRARLAGSTTFSNSVCS